MNDDPRPNPLLDEAWEDAGKAIEKFAERTNKATADLRNNDLLDEAFGVVKKSATATAEETKSFRAELKISTAQLERLNQAIQATAIPQTKAMAQYQTVLASMWKASSSLEAAASRSGAPAGGGGGAPRGPGSNGLVRFYASLASLEKFLKRMQAPFAALSKTLSAGVNEVKVEFWHMVSQLRDFGNDVAAGASKVISRIQPYIMPALTTMSSVFQSVANGIAKSGAVVGAVFGEFAANIGTAVGKSVGALASALGMGAAGIAKGGVALGEGFAKVAKTSWIVFGTAMTWFGDKIFAAGGAILGKAASAFQNVAGGGPGGHGAGGISTGSEAVGSLAGIFQSAATVVAGPMVKLGSALISGGESVGQFVGTLNPGLMLTFNRTLRDLNAVIGTALEPVMQTIVPLLQEVADAIFPIAKKFAEILKPFMEAVSPLVSAFTNLAATVMDGMLPIVDMLATALGGLAKIVTVVVDFWSKMFSGLVELAGALFKGITGMDFGAANKGFQQMIDDFVAGMKKIANTMILLSAMIAKQFGGDSFVKGLMKAFEPKVPGQAVGLAAAQNPAYKSIENLGREFALQAAISTGGAQQKKNIDDIGVDMLAELKKINEGKGDIAEIIGGLPEAIQKLPGRIAEALTQLGSQAFGVVQGVADQAVKHAEPLVRTAVQGQANPQAVMQSGSQLMALGGGLGQWVRDKWRGPAPARFNGQ